MPFPVAARIESVYMAKTDRLHYLKPFSRSDVNRSWGRSERISTVCTQGRLLVTEFLGEAHRQT